MELKEGMYVRTLNGIVKIDKIQNDVMKDTKGCLHYGDFIKISHNIIDLIEEDDLIKCQFGELILMLQVGARYTTSHPENGWIKGVFTPDNEFWSLETLQQEENIKSIVTKEQFESMSYKVGD